MSNSSDQHNKILNDLLSGLPMEVRDEVKNRLQGVINYTPRVGIMGKSGAGKSSLINGLVGKNVCETGGVGGCTRDKKDIVVNMGSREIIFTDFPGVAENSERDKEYSKMYEENLNELDIILWVIKVDDRANSNDEAFYEWLTQHYKKDQILFVLSQSDKAEPTREFNYTAYEPSNNQLVKIQQNQMRLSSDFNVPIDSVIPVACEYYNGKFERYNFDILVNRIIQQIPSEAKSSMLSTMDKSNRSKEAKDEAKESFANLIGVALDAAIDYLPIPTPMKTVARAARDFVVSGAKKVWSWIFD